MKNNVETLVAGAQQGSAKAFAELYSLYALDLYKFALYFMRNSSDAEDCVQDAVLAAFRNINRLKKPSAFKSWFFKILANICKTKLADSSRNDFQNTDEVVDYGDTDYISTEMNDALGSLDADERQIVLLSVIGKYKSSEIGKILGISAGTVRSKLSRSLIKLRSVLA